MDTVFNFAYRWRGFLVIPPVALAFFWAPLGHAARLPGWLFGAVVFASGLALRIWAQMHLHYRLKVRRRLTTTGPYALVRNPIYIGNTLLAAGVVLLLRAPLIVPLTLLWCAGLYSLVVRREELVLIERYGEPYREYRRRVPRWLPRWDSEQVSTGSHTPWFWPSVKAEVHCLLCLLLPVLREVVH